MDIDIDISPSSVLNTLPLIKASQVENGTLKPHLVGIYLQNIAQDPDTGIAAIPYKSAEDLGYYKIDILHLNLLENLESRKEVEVLSQMEPDWTLLQKTDVVQTLFHLKKHSELVTKIKPKSVEDLADILALIRPNKRVLIDQYLKNKSEVRKVLYNKIDDSDLRKSHAVAYALNIVIQLNLISLGAKFDV